MRRLAVIGLLLIAACSSPARAPQEGAVVTKADPRDVEQCKLQPKLAWCQAACEGSTSYAWCKSND